MFAPETALIDYCSVNPSAMEAAKDDTIFLLFANS